MGILWSKSWLLNKTIFLFPHLSLSYISQKGSEKIVKRKQDSVQQVIHNTGISTKDQNIPLGLWRQYSEVLLHNIFYFWTITPSRLPVKCVVVFCCSIMTYDVIYHWDGANTQQWSVWPSLRMCECVTVGEITSSFLTQNYHFGVCDIL